MKSNKDKKEKVEPIYIPKEWIKTKQDRAIINKWLKQLKGKASQIEFVSKEKQLMWLI